VRGRNSYTESSPVVVVVAAIEFGEPFGDTEIEVSKDGF
jgi:hypothetical protein